jgi:ribosomal protein L5
MFPEIDYDKLLNISGKKFILGMDIAIVTTGKTPEETCCLLKNLGIPFQPTGK